MDSERQPLLYRSNMRCRFFRPLTNEEVLTVRQEVAWRRARFFIIIMFWAIITMLLSVLTCILVTAPKCNNLDKQQPSVPPVHMTVASLLTSGRTHHENHVTFAV